MTTSGPRQQSIPGTEPDHPEVAEAIERWLEASERAKAASEKKQEADDAVVVKMLELKVTHYPYTDPETGKRKWRVVDTTPRGKSISARPAPASDADEPELSESTPSVQSAVGKLRDALSEAGASITLSSSSGTRSVTIGANGKRKKERSVEHRKVPRAVVDQELSERSERVRAQDAADAPVDEVAQADAAAQGTTRRARDWDSDDADADGERA